MWHDSCLSLCRRQGQSWQYLAYVNHGQNCLILTSVQIHFLKCKCASSFFYNLIFLSKQQWVLSIRHRRLTLATSCITSSHCSLVITPRVPELCPQLGVGVRFCSHITRRYQLHQPRPAPHPPSHRLQNQDPGHAQGHNSCKMGCWQLQSVTLRFIVEKDLRIEESFTWWLDSIGWTWLNTEVSWSFSMTKHWNLNYECYASILSIPSNIILLIMF